MEWNVLGARVESYGELNEDYITAVIANTKYLLL